MKGGEKNGDSNMDGNNNRLSPITLDGVY